MEIIWNIVRRWLRSALTISGIVIGSFVLTTGTLAEYFHTLVHSYVTYYGDNVQVMDAKCRRFRRLGAVDGHGL